MAKQQVGLKLEPDMVASLDAKARAEGLTRTQAVEVAITRWLDGPEASAVLDALPKAPTPGRADLVRRPLQTKTPPPVKARAIRVECQVGPIRPAPGSRLKKR